jgi:hypothetical protein
MPRLLSESVSFLVLSTGIGLSIRSELSTMDGLENRPYHKLRANGSVFRI